MPNETAPAHTSVSFKYDTEPCSRCGGSGQYSHCEMHGSDCFKCVVAGNPKGLQSTEDAVKARNAITAFRESLMSVAVADVKVGDVINATSNRAGTARYGKACRMTVTEIGPVTLQGVGGSGAKACAWLKEHEHLSMEEKAAIVDANPDLCVEMTTRAVKRKNKRGYDSVPVRLGLHVVRVVTIKGEKTSIQAPVNGTLLRMPTPADVLKIAEFARTLKGVTVIFK